MKIKKLFTYLSLFVMLFSACSEKTEPVPPAPANTKAVMDFVKGKKLQAKQVGFFGNITVNGVKEIEWLDVSGEKDKTKKDAASEELNFSLQFINDTAVTIRKKDKTFTGTYVIDDKTAEMEDEKPGIKLKISFADPDFNLGFGGGAPMEVTYTYPVLGLDSKRLMLETPRSINRQKLISIMSE